MYLVHVALGCRGGSRPTQADAEQLVDRIWARAAPELGIQHLYARAGPHRIDLAVYLAGPPPAEPLTATGTAIPRILELIPEWTPAEARNNGEETA